MLCKYKSTPGNLFSSKLNLISKISGDLCGYNKDKPTYKMNFDAVDILIGVRLLIIPFKEALSQPLASNVTWCSGRRLLSWNKGPTAIKAFLLPGKRSDNCVVLLLNASRYNKTNPWGSFCSCWSTVTIVTEVLPSVSSFKNKFKR